MAEAEKKPRKRHSGDWGAIFGNIFDAIYAFFFFVILPVVCLSSVFIKFDSPPDKDATNPKKSLSGFYGVKWGSTQQEARTVLQRKGFQFDEKETTERRLIVIGKEEEDEKEENDLRFRGSAPDYLILYFGNEGFYQAYDDFESDNETSVYSPNYDDARYSLGQIYGKPKYEAHLLPTADGEPLLKAEDIKAGKAKLKAQWDFKNNHDKQTLTMGIKEETMSIWVRYRDEKRYAVEKTNVK